MFTARRGLRSGTELRTDALWTKLNTPEASQTEQEQTDDKIVHHVLNMPTKTTQACGKLVLTYSLEVQQRTVRCGMAALGLQIDHALGKAATNLELPQ